MHYSRLISHHNISHHLSEYRSSSWNSTGVTQSVQEPRAIQSKVVDPTEINNICSRFIEELAIAFQCCQIDSDRDWNTIVRYCLTVASANQPDNVLAALKVMAARVTADAFKAPCLGDVCGVDTLPNGSVQQNGCVPLTGRWDAFACPLSADLMVPLFWPTDWHRCWQPTLAADLRYPASKRRTDQRKKNSFRQLVDWHSLCPPEFVTIHDVENKYRCMYREVVGEDHIAAVAKQVWIAGEHSVRYSCHDLRLKWVPIQNQVDAFDWALVTKAEAMYLLAMRGWPYSESDSFLNTIDPASPIQLRELPN